MTCFVEKIFFFIFKIDYCTELEEWKRFPTSDGTQPTYLDIIDEKKENFMKET